MVYKKKSKVTTKKLEYNLLRAKIILLELLKMVKEERNLTYQEQEVALYLIAEDISRVTIGVPKRKRIGG